MNIMAHIEKAAIICPHCNYAYDLDDMSSCDEDLFAIAPNEAEAKLECIQCEQEFIVQGGYKPFYSTAFASEELF